MSGHEHSRSCDNVIIIRVFVVKIWGTIDMHNCIGNRLSAEFATFKKLIRRVGKKRGSHMQEHVCPRWAGRPPRCGVAEHEPRSVLSWPFS